MVSEWILKYTASWAMYAGAMIFRTVYLQLVLVVVVIFIL